jgi:hypothetical protein
MHVHNFDFHSSIVCCGQSLHFQKLPIQTIIKSFSLYVLRYRENLAKVTYDYFTERLRQCLRYLKVTSTCM